MVKILEEELQLMKARFSIALKKRERLRSRGDPDGGKSILNKIINGILTEIPVRGKINRF